jgi:hypothetical protein
MQDSLLFHLFLQFTELDRRKIRKWLISPFFSPREEVQHLFIYLETNANKPAALEKEKIWAKICPKLPYNESTFNHLMWHLLKQLKQYIAYTEWQNDAVDAQIRLCQGLRNYNAPPEMLEKELETGAETLEKEPYRDAQYHFQNMVLQREKFEHTTLLKRDPSMPLALHSVALETGFLLQTLRYACTTQNLRNVLKEQPHPALIQQVIDNITENNLEQPLVRLYFHLNVCLQDQKAQDSYYKVKADLQAFGHLMREKERRDVYLLAINYCIRRLNTGEKEFIKEAFDLYNIGLENRSLFENGVLSKFSYKNAVNLGMGLGNYEWVRQFLEDYRPFLPEREREAIYNFNLATYYFRLPDYDAAMSLLRAVDFGNDSLTEMNARSMLLRIYFEKNYSDALESLLDSFSVYLRRQKNIGYQKWNYLNLIRFTRRLLTLSTLDEKAQLKLKEEIGQTKALAEKAWLLGKFG